MAGRQVEFRGIDTDALVALLAMANLTRPSCWAPAATQISSLLCAGDEHWPKELVFIVASRGDGGVVPFEIDLQIQDSPSTRSCCGGACRRDLCLEAETGRPWDEATWFAGAGITRRPIAQHRRPGVQRFAAAS